MFGVGWLSMFANHVWQTTVFAFAAAALALALRSNSARTRFWIWLAASVKFLVPFALLIAAGNRIALTTKILAHSSNAPKVIEKISEPFAPVTNSIRGIASTPPHRLDWLPICAVAVWICGALVIGMSWLHKWWRVRRIVGEASPVTFEMGIPVLSSASMLEPGVFGIFRPVLVIPEGIADRLTREHLNAVLTHELCHVRRHDNLWAALHMFVEALFWFHPLVWWIALRLLEERERACDEEVIRIGNRPDVYAESILKTCRFYLESPVACVSGVTGGDLKKRIAHIMTEKVSVRLTYSRKLLLAGASVAMIAAPITAGLLNAAQIGTDSTQPSFEVASVKLAQNVDPNRRDSTWRDRPGKMMVNNVRLRTVIERAYAVKDYQISGPEWLRSEQYDITAEWPPTEPRDKFPLMLQTLLRDRFKLAFHREEKTLPVYELRVSSNGPTLRPGEEHHESGFTTRWGWVTAQNVSMSEFTDELSRQVARPVLDATSLAGAFNFDLRWAPDDIRTQTFEESSDSPNASGPSLFTAIQEQLGLKLVPSKDSVDILVIDHIERIPTEN